MIDSLKLNQKPLRSFKICLAGDSLVGKKSLFLRLKNGTFTPETLDKDLQEFPLGINDYVVRTSVGEESVNVLSKNSQHL